MKRIGLSIGLIAAGLCFSGLASAQAAAPPPDAGGAHTHDGFYFRIGLNIGPLMTTATPEVNGTEGTEAKYSGLHTGTDLMFGGTPVPGLAIGGALVTNFTSDPTVKAGSVEGKADGTMIFSGIAAFGDYYFDPHGGGHVMLMLGFAAADFVSSSGSSGGNDPTGPMVAIGGGYDFWIGNEWSVGPVARILYAPLSAEEEPLKVKYSYLYPSIGVAFTLH
jgi:hypothetical protein